MAYETPPDFTAFTTLPADSLDILSNDIEELHNGTGFASDSIPASAINFGGAGSGLWWEEIGRTTLGVAGDTITINPFTAKKYLLILYSLIPSGQINPTIRFNNDSGNNYASRFSPNGGGSDTTAVSQNRNFLDTGGAVTVPIYGFMEFSGTNVTTREKLSFSTSYDVSATGAGTAPGRRLQWQKWANTSDQITRLDVTNIGTGDFAIGSEVVVLGHD